MASRRKLIVAAATAVAGLLAGTTAGPGLIASARAQGPKGSSYPERTVKIIMPASPGTAVDTTARFFAERLSRRLGVPVVVENRDGAGGAIGIQHAARAAPDGYTVLFTGIPIYATPHVSETPVGFDPLKDFVPIARFNGSALAFVVPAASPYRTLPELVAAMQARPDDLTFASGGNGSTSQMCTALLNDMTKTKARHVPYKGNSPAVNDTAGGQVDFTCNSAAVLPLVKSGKLRALAVTSRQRWPELPDVPTVAETGVEGYEISSWIGAMVPAGTPKAVVARLAEAMLAIAEGDDFRDFCLRQSMYVDIIGHEAFAAGAPAEAARWKRLAELTKAK